MDSEVFELAGRSVTVGTLLIPMFAGLIGLGTNWVAIKMMFLPLEWVGWRLPFKVGFGRYKMPIIGWQGVIPSKAAKMGSIAVDTGLAKLGTLYEFYRSFEPEQMAAHIVATARPEIHAQVDSILQREYPDLWIAAPEGVKRMVHDRVETQLPSIVARVLEEIGQNIDRLLDLKLMVIRYMETHPELINRIFQEVGAKEFRFIIGSGGWMGFLLGLVPMGVWIAYPEWWTVPVGAAIVGYLTNWIALKVIFEPLEPRRVGPFTLFGLFLRRQDEVAVEYSALIATEIVTLDNVAEAMINGPDGDRTKRLVADTLGPVVDEAVGRARPLVKAAAGGRYESIKASLADAAVDQTMGTLLDPAFAAERSRGMQALLEERMRGLPPAEFAQMLRAAFEQDEWMLIMVGALLGFAAGVVQLGVTL